MDDALVRIQRLRDVVRFAQATLKAFGKMGTTDTLKIFVAPEFYFRLGDDGYPHAGLGGTKVGSVTTDNPCSVQTIIDTLRATFQTEEFRDWLIIPGTIFSHEGELTSAQRWILVTEQDTSGSDVVKKVTDWNKVDWTKTKIWDVSKDDPSILTNSVVYPLYRAHYSPFNGTVASNYFNTTVVIKGGAHLSSTDPGYVLNWKGPMSNIDVPWFGSRPRDSASRAYNLNDLDPTLRDARNNALYKTLLDQWPTVKERIFTIDGITFGLEICLDHGAGILKRMIADWTKSETEWTSLSKAYFRNDVGIDLQNVGRDALSLLTLDSTKLLQNINSLSAATSWSAPSVVSQVKGLTLDAAKIPDAKVSLAKAFARGLARLDDLNASEKQSAASGPSIDVHIISSCGIAVAPLNVCARNGGYVVHCDGSVGTWNLSAGPSRRYTLGKQVGTNLAVEPDTSKSMDVKVSADLELLPPPAAGTSWYEQRVIAYAPKPL
ncbi:hypothetical protein D7V93_17845 [Corallococcus llansteffanensis]|uniref:Uncharacterized protein n=1 Tax=Corallococcus llansteffanensis TaxID=2316731 RepID=A0A3A8PSF7_9BACT|nr:hypothetical protein D7V93_17845 [Corallococcus llansteffanensis]